jgi:hypothetical protein
MKIYMTKTYSVFESYGPIEINLEDYPDLQGKSEEEILEHFNQIMYEETIEGGSESNLVDEFTFNTEMIKQKYSNEEEEIVNMTHKEFYIWLEGYLTGKLENKHIEITPIVEKMSIWLLMKNHQYQLDNLNRYQFLLTQYLNMTQYHHLGILHLKINNN